MPDNAPPQVIVQQAPPTAFGRYGRFLVFALILAVMALIGQHASYKEYFSPPDKPQERYHSLSETAIKKVAIIDVEGAIMDADDGFVKAQIDRVREDDNVVAVVLRIDSPGGTVTSSDYLYHHLRKLADDRKLPMVVSMGSICASGGYYLAMAVGGQPEAIFAEPTTWTGSIGVVIPHYDLSGLLTEHNVKDDSIASHKYKLMGSPTRALTPEQREEERKLLQELVDISFGRFKGIVAKGRPKLAANPADLDKVATGQVFTAEQALELGLVDRVGFIEDAIDRAATLANVSKSDIRCVKYDKPPTTLGSLLGADSPLAPAGVQWNLSTLLDLAAPRAYYLFSGLPALVRSAR